MNYGPKCPAGVARIIEGLSRLEDLLIWVRRRDMFDIPHALFHYALGNDPLRDEVLCLESFISFFRDLPSPSTGLEFFLVPALVLAIVYQYLFGCVARGGTKTYNSGSLEFRSTFVSLLLFLGAYVWIKFRDVANRTVSRRTNKLTGNPVGKFLPKFKPPREKDNATGIPLVPFQCLRLGGYDSYQDAKVVCQIAGYFYNGDEALVQLDDGFQFRIPPMSEKDQRLTGMAKWERVSDKAKEVFELFKEDHDRWREILRALNGDVAQPEQSADNVNNLFDYTLPQPLTDVSEVLEAVSGAGIDGTRMGSGAADHDYQLRENLSSPDSRSQQGGSSALSSPTSTRATSATNAIADKEKPVFDVPTTISERADGTLLISGGTDEADFLCGINEHEEGQDCWFTEFLRIMSGDVELQT